MTDGHSWDGNWKVRLYERVREQGYDSLTAFAEARPTASLVALAEELGEDDVNAVQVFSGLVAEAERSHQITRLIRGQLVRELAQHLPNGWPAMLDDANRFDVAHALARWSIYTDPFQGEGEDRLLVGLARKHLERGKQPRVGHRRAGQGRWPANPYRKE